jgi:hypothetical protein
VKRIYNTPIFMIVAEGDDLTLWDLEIGAFNAIPSVRKKLHVLPHTTHMTLYSDASRVQTAVKLATDQGNLMIRKRPAAKSQVWRCRNPHCRPTNCVSVRFARFQDLKASQPWRRIRCETRKDVGP